MSKRKVVQTVQSSLFSVSSWPVPKKGVDWQTLRYSLIKLKRCSYVDVHRSILSFVTLTVPVPCKLQHSSYITKASSNEIATLTW